MKKSVVIILCLIIAVFSFGETNVLNDLNGDTVISIEETNFNHYEEHGPIYIWSDDDFLLYEYSGNGTSEDPYIIENYSIKTTSIDGGVDVSHTTKHFVIRNCYFYTSSWCVKFYKIADGTASIINNTFIDSYMGISLNGVHGTDIINNTFLNIENAGLQLSSSYDNNIINNSFYNSGINIYYSELEAYLSNYVSGNKVNDKLLGYYTNLTDVSFTEPIYGQLILANCSDLVICNQEITYTCRGMILQYCSNFTLYNNTCKFNQLDGLAVIDCWDGILKNNICHENSDNGISLYRSSNIILEQNSCRKNDFWGGIYSSGGNQNKFLNNTCNTNFNNGIHISGGYEFLIMDNNCSTNQEEGISLYYGSSKTVITNNTCIKNNIGIRLLRSSSCLIVSNLILENKAYGVFIKDDCNNNKIYHNLFIRNNLEGSSQAYESCKNNINDDDDCTNSNNIWFNEETNTGNHWSDWNSGKPYPIDGESGSYDKYPMDESMETMTAVNQFFLITLIALALIPFLFRKKRFFE
ncbi:MAG: right-handed parallel beta-helix repeat-containing protein [Candidatus Heimdallarchaeaceae archaeon]